MKSIFVIMLLCASSSIFAADNFSSKQKDSKEIDAYKQKNPDGSVTFMNMKISDGRQSYQVRGSELGICRRLGYKMTLDSDSHYFSGYGNRRLSALIDDTGSVEELSSTDNIINIIVCANETPKSAVQATAVFHHFDGSVTYTDVFLNVYGKKYSMTDANEVCRGLKHSKQVKVSTYFRQYEWGSVVYGHIDQDGLPVLKRGGEYGEELIGNITCRD